MIGTLEKGATLEGATVLIVKKSEATTKRGSPYLTLDVRDKTGTISGKFWDYNPAEHSWIKEGDVAVVSGPVEEYQGNLQLVIKRVDPSLESPDKFAKSSRFGVEEMWTDLVALTATFQEPLTKFVTEEILLKQEPFIEAFKKAPAARSVHNAWFGGLLEHVHALCTIAEPVIQHYRTRYCEKLSRDKVLFGLIMHDAGKVIEYDFSNPSFPTSPVGQFTNHLVVGPAWVYEKANLFPNKGPDFKIERAHLMHVLAAHHGQLEWGSPVKPASLEAILVHHLDNLDSKVMHAMDFVLGKKGPTPHFSAQSYFEKTPYYQYD